MKLLLELFLVFAKCSAVTFGGGYAVLPILQREIVEDRHWATENDLMDYYAISQVTPGMIAVNVATFIGLKLKGFWGGVFATLGTIFPSMVIISIIALFLTQFENNPIVVHAFAGMPLSNSGRNPSKTKACSSSSSRSSPLPSLPHSPPSSSYSSQLP